MKVKLTLTIVITILTILTACNLKSQSPSIDQFIPEGYELVSTTSGDLNLDKYPDIILILNKLEVEEESSGIRPLLILLGQKDGSYKLFASNENVVMGGQAGGMMGEPLQGVTIEKGSFTVEHTYGSRELTNTEVTFKYSAEDNDWFLYEYSESMVDRLEPEDATSNIMTTKDFGNIPFDKYEGSWSLYGIKQQMIAEEAEAEIEEMDAVIVWIEAEPQSKGDKTWKGGNITATLNGGTLTISGTGTLEPNIGCEYAYPWWEEPYAGYNKVIINEGITEIEGGLAGPKLTSIIFPSSLKKIGAYAFDSPPLVSITIGANVELGGWDSWGYDPSESVGEYIYAISDAFDDAYNYNYDKQAGTYILKNDEWTKQ